MAVYTDADPSGPLSLLSLKNLTAGNRFHLVPDVVFSWGSVERVFILVICIAAAESNCGLVLQEETGTASRYRLPCSYASPLGACHLCPQQKEVLRNHVLSVQEASLTIRTTSQTSSSQSTSCPAGVSQECLEPSRTSAVVSLEYSESALLLSSGSNMVTTSTALTSTSGLGPTATSSVGSDDAVKGNSSCYHPAFNGSLVLVLVVIVHSVLLA
jgi:hypothetical protein